MILHQVSMWWVSYPMIEIRNCSGTCWKIEGLKQIIFFLIFGLQVSFVASRCDGREEESFPMWGTNTGQTDRLINCFDQKSWRRPWRQQNNRCLSSSPVKLRLTARTCCSVHQMQERLCSIHLQRSLNQCPRLCGASIFHMKSSEAKSLGSNVTLKRGFTLNCKIYPRFCLKGTGLQEDSWSAYLIRGNRQYFPLFFYSSGLIFVCMLNILWKLAQQ